MTTTPPPPLPPTRFALLGELLQVMMQRNAAPPIPALTGPAFVPPTVTSLAQNAAGSAVAIAQAVADLGQPPSASGQDDSDRAQIIWQETLAQIARIQGQFGLPALPFQPPPESGPHPIP